MTALTAPPPPSKPVGSTSGMWRRRGGRSRRPAAAVIARGEPMLWLTAGALAIALFMITGLVALVVVMGGGTFWPARLERVELLDGRVLLGEAAGRETYELTRARLDSLPEAARPAAEKLLAGRSEAEATRTRYRVDNKQLGGESFVWVDDLLRKPGGTTRPEWAVTVERTTWGRFLGTPQSFTVLRPRPVPGAEEQLDKLIAFFEENSHRADEAGRLRIEEWLETLRGDRDDARAKGTAEFLKRIGRERTDAKRVSLLETGDELPLTGAAADRPIVAVRETWSGPQASWSKFEAARPPVEVRLERIRDLNRSITSADARVHDARMEVIEAGLALSATLEPAAKRLAELDAAAEEVEASRESRRQIMAAVARRSGGGSDVEAAARSIVVALDAEAAGELAAAENEIDAIEADLPSGGRKAVDRYRAVDAEARRRTAEVAADMSLLRAENERYVWTLAAADGAAQDIPVAEIVRAFPANRLDFVDRLGVYLSRWAEFLTGDPREANTEGGVFPAIWGTVAMTLIMTLAVVPFGVLAALFLREYAKAGPVISAVRIAVNNLAGVPSIVFGVFGLGFFCYVVGGGIDRAFYPEYVAQNQPVFGTGGLMWASLTLALLTLPVVIVATEEALSAVPNSLREGSYACGASKWQTIRRIVLPRALPGIMTGMILAMARGAGEVAPLMLVGAAKIAPDLPVDGEFPFVHPTRSFMHLGFHIYDLGFQSPDSEAAKPMVFTTTLLLITIVAGLNIVAIRLRSRLRRRFSAGQF